MMPRLVMLSGLVMMSRLVMMLMLAVLLMTFVVSMLLGVAVMVVMVLLCRHNVLLLFLPMREWFRCLPLAELKVLYRERD